MNKSVRITGCVAHEAYEYLKDLSNYAEYFGDLFSLDPDSGNRVAYIKTKMPAVGTVRVVVLELVRDTKIVLSAKSIGTKITFEFEPSGTADVVVKTSVEAKPKIGIIIDSVIKSLVPKYLDQICSELTKKLGRE